MTEQPEGPTTPIRTDKPWGHELLWANTPHYLGKLLFIRAGEALSLQYHQHKEETLIVLRGEVSIEYFMEHQAAQTKRLAPHAVLHIPPGLRHRITALVDSELAEVSSPQPDPTCEDVVRLKDRYGRAG